jgi:hypothetical protein
MAACSGFVSGAHRIPPAHWFDPLAHGPPIFRRAARHHQITAVWEAMLPCQPLHFLLLDDPGAGKTSMAGLFIKELTRGDFDRGLVVSHGSLAARFEGRFRDDVHQVEVSRLMRRLVKEIRSNSTRRRCFLGARLYRSVQALAGRLAPPQRGYGLCAHRIFKSWTIWTRSWRSSRGVAIDSERADSDYGVDRRHEVELAEPPKIT